MDLFATLDSDDACTQDPNASWDSDSKYRQGQARVHDLAVVKDSAEQAHLLSTSSITHQQKRKKTVSPY